jgi:hypothetical protein
MTVLPPGTAEPLLPREVRHEFDAYLQAQYRAQGATTTPLQYQVLAALLTAAEAGATPVDGTLHYIQRQPGAGFYANPGAMAQTASAPRLTPGLRVALIATAILFVVGVVLFNTVLAPPAASRPVGPSASPAGTPASTPEITPTAIPLGILRIGQAEVPPVFPVTLQIGERAWAVVAAPVDHAGGNWQVTEGANQANWLPGSVINWVFGLWDDQDSANAGVLRGLPAAAEAILRMSNGAARTFRLPAARAISRLEIGIFAQRTPGVTLVLVGGPATAPALVTQGTEIPPRAGAPAPPREP